MGVPIFCADKRPGFRPSIRGRLRQFIKVFTPDVIHTHQVGVLVYAGPEARHAGIPAVIHTEHNNHFANPSRKMGLIERNRMRLVWWTASRYADRFVCVSGDIASELARQGVVPKRKLSVVPNGIDIERLEGQVQRDAIRSAMGIPSDAPVVGTVGRLSEAKRQDRLIRAFARILSDVPDAHLMLVGDGPLRGELRDLAASHGISSRVHFAGYQSQPGRYLSSMDVFAQSSRIEGMPLSVLEAWAIGIPVVASRVGGLPEMIEDHRTGLLFDHEDEDALVAAIGLLIRDRGFAAQIAAAGRERVREYYDLRIMTAAYDRHYRELLAETRAGS